jgi:hypothetical protein
MIRTLPVICLSALCIFTSISLSAQGANDDPIRVKKTTDFTVTGAGTAPEWQKAVPVTLIQRQGKVSYNTTMRILWSDKGIYLLYESEDTKLTSTIREDFKDIFNEDVVEAFFWPDERSVIYFEYELSPYNFELPILVPNYNAKLFGWLPWHYEGDRRTVHKTLVHEKNGKLTGWTGEVFIPFVLLTPLQNVPPAPGTAWRANFYRIDYDVDMAEWSWKKTGPSFHEYEKFGKIVFE